MFFDISLFKVFSLPHTYKYIVAVKATIDKHSPHAGRRPSQGFVSVFCYLYFPCSKFPARLQSLNSHRFTKGLVFLSDTLSVRLIWVLDALVKV